MNLLFDHQTFVEQPYGGISRYIIELMKGINATPPNKARLSLLYATNAYLPGTPSVLDRILKPGFPGKRRVLSTINKLYSQSQLLREPYDLFHATYYDPYFLPYLGKKPFVVTFHDMIHERYSQHYNLLGNDRSITRNKKKVAEQATQLIAVSEATKRDVVELLDINPDKIHVIYHGCSFAPRLKQTVTDDRRYLLYVGHRHAYKNFQAMLRAIAPLLNQHDCSVICAGGGSFTTDEQALMHSLGVTNRVQWRSIDTDETLRQLYENAQAFVFPSLYEGFGMPVLEAFTSGCPCIVSNNSSLPEVAGDAALYIDPDDDESIRHAIDSILCDPHLRSKLIEKGYQRASLFAWAKTTSQTLNVYEQCLG